MQVRLRQDITAHGLRAFLAFVAFPAASLAASHSFGKLLKLGLLSQHMLDHIALLGIAAPASAWMLRSLLPRVSGQALTAAAIIQIVLIWAWHLPPVFSAAVQSDGLAHVVMAASLYLAGLFFWCTVVGLAERRLWQAILAMLVTGKLFCLFAAVLVFSPRLLYDIHAGHAHHGAQAAFSGIDDQHLAGLIMIAICPLTYVLAGIVISIRWFTLLEARYGDVSRPAVLRSSSLVGLLALLLSGCSSVQSTFVPASPEAQSAYHLTWLLFVGGTAIFVLVMVLTVLAIIGGERMRGALGSTRAIAIGGIVFPTVVLSALLVYGLWLARASAAPAGDDVQDIAVQGERWWWRVTYADPDTQEFSSANEIRVQVGRPVRLKLTSPDVIHSFWVPALAGKVDLIPGRTNELRFTATQAGIFRGQCAEYCGGPHALMALRVVAMEPDDFTAWIAAEKQPAAQPGDDPRIRRGHELFGTLCVACHAVRGTDAAGRLGPDLTHIAGRGAIGGEVLEMSKENLARWLVENDRLKPNNLMPEYGHLPSGDVDAITAYLASLE